MNPTNNNGDRLTTPVVILLLICFMAMGIIGGFAIWLLRSIGWFL